MPSWVVVGPGDDAAVIEPERGALDVAHDRRAGRRRSFRSPVRAARRDRAPGARRQPQRPGGDGRRTARRAAVARAARTPWTSRSSTACSTACSALAGEHRVALVGGNITRTPGPLIVDVTAIGSVRPRRRADARRRAAGRRACTSPARSANAVGWPAARSSRPGGTPRAVGRLRRAAVSAARAARAGGPAARPQSRRLELHGPQRRAGRRACVRSAEASRRRHHARRQRRCRSTARSAHWHAGARPRRRRRGARRRRRLRAALHRPAGAARTAARRAQADRRSADNADRRGDEGPPICCCATAREPPRAAARDSSTSDDGD